MERWREEGHLQQGERAQEPAQHSELGFTASRTIKK